MRTIFVTAAALVVISGSAAADGVYRNPYSYSAPLLYNWSGFYVGGNAGFAWGHSDATTTTDCPATNPPGYICSQNTASSANVSVVDAAGSGTLHPNGFTGGGQAGYNLQSGNFVYGVEVDFGALNLGASRSGSGEWFVAGPANFTTGSSISTDWLFTARARLGWAMSNVLIYATGGLAVTDLHVHNFYQDDLALGGRENSSNTDTKTGWTVGGGLEMALDSHWSVKGEYLFVDFNGVSTTGNVTNPVLATFANPLSVSEDLSVNIARAGINYRF